MTDAIDDNEHRRYPATGPRYGADTAKGCKETTATPTVTKLTPSRSSLGGQLTVITSQPPDFVRSPDVHVLRSLPVRLRKTTPLYFSGQVILANPSQLLYR